MNTDELVLGLHLIAHGFGWILFEGPNAPLDWGVVEKKNGDKNAHCLFAIERIIERYHPAVIAHEEYAARPGNERVMRLCRSIDSLAVGRNIAVCTLSRSQILALFARFGVKTRHEVATAIATHLEAIRSRLPGKRALWESEKSGIALFSAAAAALAYYWIEDDLAFA